ncbi:NUDIX domain-containing protein [Caloramator fervidus]|uniref:NUDIX domain-containing protein n=1 Tax=Caloramator fervidus TaxID=29344 RepID=A0A1H5W4F1_9CLOT|nr:CoA pyrophosphatase [Caloramator fervidus]SEF94365.1 NUDIX domain-containing protein [Caloramator fervidus]
MKINLERLKLKLKRVGIIGEGIDLKSYAVTIPLVKDNDWQIIFQVRSKNLSQAGEVSLPGGKVEKGEKIEEAAIRETCEELLLDASNIEVLGQSDILVTQYGKIIYPFVVKILDKNKVRYSRYEVEKIFFVPVKFFIENEPKIMKIKVKTEPLGEFPYDLKISSKDYNWQEGMLNVYFYKYNDYVIWGLTAKIIYNFIQKIKDLRSENE